MDINRYRLPGLERQFSRAPRDKAYCVILRTGEKPPGFLEESFEEIQELASAAAVRVLGSTRANVPHPSPSHFLREGKLTEVRDKAKTSGANILIFNVDLTPSQAAHIEVFAKIPVVDRTGLILEIFGRRARTKEGKLQVELAYLNYVLPRLGGLGNVMSRLGGGIGTRGPGEPELERDRRKVRTRIHRMKEELKQVEKHRKLIRSGRRRKNFISAAIVGYTNAGKSTLLNALTGASAYVEDKVFATLDPVARVETVNGNRNILFIDTVGFLKDLPHALVESFHATLEEVTEADILVHVLDVSNPRAEECRETVGKVLKEINAEGKPVVLALNKADLLNEDEKRRVPNLWPEGVLISARDKLGLNGLLEKLETALNFLFK